nr:hypothetical protein [Tanacetum cinerariifolium]
MESLSPQVVSAAKLPILNPNEFDLWKMRIEHTNEPVGVAASVSVVSAKIPVSALPNVDTLSNAVIYSFFASQSTSPQLDNDDLKQINADDLEEINLKWQMAMLTVEEEPTNYALMAFTSSSSDNEVVSCLKACTKAYATLQSHYDKMTDDFRKSQFDLRDNALVVLRQNLEKAKQERDDLKLKLEKFQTSSKNLSQLLASQTNDKTRLGYTTQVLTHSMIDCDEYFTSESDESLPLSPIYDSYQSGDGYHAVPPPYTRTFMPPKPDLVFHDAPNVNETVHTAFIVERSLTKPDKDLSPTPRPLAHIIEDWVSDSDDDSETKILQNAPSFVPPSEQVKTPRSSINPVETSIPAANLKTAIPKHKSQ